MLSKGVGVYHMPNQNTRIGVTIRKMRVLARLRTAKLGGSFWRFFLYKSPSWKYIRIKCLDIPLHPFKYLKWHKGKKHRHHRLSLLLRGLLATRPVVLFNVVLRTPLK